MTAIVNSLYADNMTIQDAMKNPKTPAHIQELIDADPTTPWFEIIPEDGTLIKPYFDWDCKEVSPADFEAKKTEVLETAKKQVEELGFSPEHTCFAERHGDDAKHPGLMKVSYRGFVLNATTTKEDLRNTITHYSKHLNKPYIDPLPYSRNRKLGLVGCVKDNRDQRRLTLMSPDKFSPAETLVADVDEALPRWNMPVFEGVETPKIEVKTPLEKTDFPSEEEVKSLIPDLEKMGFTNIKVFSNSNEFSCDQIGRGVKCPCCRLTHESNNFRITKNDFGTFFVKSHSQKCERKPVKGDSEYDFKKHQFEEVEGVAKVKSKHIYIVRDGDEIRCVNKAHLEEEYLNWRLEGKKGGTDPFVKAWLEDPKCKTYRDMDYYPEGCADDVYNLWNGFAIQRADFEMDDTEINKRIEPYLKVVKAISNIDEVEKNYVLDWFAFMFQHPSKQTKTCLVIYGQQGDGKSKLMEIHGKLLGKEHYWECDEVDDLVGKFVCKHTGKRFINVDEIDVYKDFKKIRRLIDADTIRVRKLYNDGYDVRNLGMYAFTSNETNQIKAEMNARRPVIFKSSNALNPAQGSAEERLERRAFWKNWVEVYTKDERNLRAIYLYLMKRNIEGIDWVNDRPRTEAHIEMEMSSLPPELKFLEHYITRAYPDFIQGGRDISGKDFFKLFQKFYPAHAKYDYDLQKFGLNMRKLLKNEGVYSDTTSLKQSPYEVIKPFHKSRDQHGITWVINRAEAFEWLKAKGYTQEPDLPPPFLYTMEDFTDKLFSFENTL